MAADPEHDRRQAEDDRLQAREREPGSAALGARFFGGAMRLSFGARPTRDGVSFRLWAPAARRVDLLLDRRHAMQRRQDGWYVAEIANLPVGSTYKFRIDDEIDVPDPASAFQPDDV